MSQLFTILDIVLFFIIIIFGLLSMVRGFLKEFLNIIAWVSSFFIIKIFYYFLKKDILKLINDDVITQIIFIITLFIIVFVIISIINNIIINKLFKNKISILDKTLGFIFGGFKGFLLVIICYLILILIIPDENNHSIEISNARSIIIIKESSSILLNIISTIFNNSIVKFIQDIKNNLY